MFVNEEGKITDAVEYFYNPFIEKYCVKGTKLCADELDMLQQLFANAELLCETALPEYITDGEYDAENW